MSFFRAVHFHALIVFAGFCSAIPGFATRPRPNVLMIAVDDMRDWVGHLGGYGGKVHTPNIDRLAAEGVAFMNAHCASPVCNPSRTAVMTGRMPSQTGVYDNSQWLVASRPDVTTLPAYFRAHGYLAVEARKCISPRSRTRTNKSDGCSRRSRPLGRQQTFSSMRTLRRVKRAG